VGGGCLVTMASTGLGANVKKEVGKRLERKGRKNRGKVRGCNSRQRQTKRFSFSDFHLTGEGGKRRNKRPESREDRRKLPDIRCSRLSTCLKTAHRKSAVTRGVLTYVLPLGLARLNREGDGMKTESFGRT